MQEPKGSRARAQHDKVMGGQGERNGSTLDGARVPSGWVEDTRNQLVSWAAGHLKMHPALVQVHWLSLCAGQQSDFVGLVPGDTYESFDVLEKVECSDGQAVHTDFVCDLRAIDFRKLVAHAKANFPRHNLLVLACYPTCGYHGTLSKGTNQAHVERAPREDCCGRWRPRRGAAGAKARAAAALFDHCLAGGQSLLDDQFQLG